MGTFDEHDDLQAIMEARELLTRLQRLGVSARAQISGGVAPVICYCVDTPPPGETGEELQNLISRHSRREFYCWSSGEGYDPVPWDDPQWARPAMLESRQRYLEDCWLARHGGEGDFPGHCRKSANLALSALNRIGALGFDVLVIGSLGTPWFGWRSDVDLFIASATTLDQIDHIRHVCRQLEGGERIDLLFSSLIITDAFRAWALGTGRRAEAIREWGESWRG